MVPMKRNGDVCGPLISIPTPMFASFHVFLSRLFVVKNVNGPPSPAGGWLPSDGPPNPPGEPHYQHTRTVSGTEIALQNERIQWQHVHKRCGTMHHRALNS